MYIFVTDAALYVAQYLASLAKTSTKGKCREINPLTWRTVFHFKQPNIAIMQ